MKKFNFFAPLLCFVLAFAGANLLISPDLAVSEAVAQTTDGAAEAAPAPDSAPEAPAAEPAAAEASPEKAAEAADGEPEAAVPTDAGAAAGSPELPDTPEELMSTGRSLVTAVKDGKWLLAAMLFLFGAVGLIRLVGSKLSWLEWSRGKLAGWILNFVGSVTGMIATSVAAGMALSLDTFIAAVVTSLAVAGAINLKGDVKKAMSG